MKKNIITFILIMAVSCSGDKKVPENNEVVIPENSFAYTAAVDIYKNLKKTGLSDCEAFIISRGALICAKDSVIETSVSGNYNWDDFSAVLPSLAAGGIENIDKAEVSSVSRDNLIFAISYSLASSFISRSAAISADQKGLLIKSALKQNIGKLNLSSGAALPDTAAQHAARGFLAAINESELNPAEIARSTEGVIEGTVSGLIELAGINPALSTGLSLSISGIIEASFAALNDSKLIQEQKGYIVKLMVSAAARPVMESGTIDLPLKKDILLAITEKAAGSVDEAQLHAFVIYFAVPGIVDGIYSSLDNAFRSAYPDFLTELKTSAKTGADSINNSILPGGITIGVAYLDNLINSYSSDYNDLFTNTMPDSSVYGNSADNNGIWKLEDGSTLTVVNNGGCWLFSGTVSKIYQATYEGSFTVSGSEFTEYKRFILKDINGINPDINATLSIAVVTRSIDYDIMTVDVKLRALSGIIDNNSFSSQQARLSTADVVEYRDIVCRLSTRTQPPLGTGLGGLGGVSTVLGTYSDPFNSPVDGSVTVNVTVTGFFANDPCAR